MNWNRCGRKRWCPDLRHRNIDICLDTKWDHKNPWTGNSQGHVEKINGIKTSGRELQLKFKEFGSMVWPRKRWFRQALGDIRKRRNIEYGFDKEIWCNNKVIIILIHEPCVFYYFVLWPTNAQLFKKLSPSYMFRYYRVILRELVITTLQSYTSISNAVVGNQIHT